MVHRRNPLPDDAVRRLFELALDRARQLLDAQGVAVTAHFNPLHRRQNDQRRVHALAVVQACAELAAELGRIADDASHAARTSHASYAEIGSARGISRQAARQAILRRDRRRSLEQEELRARFSEANQDEDHWYDDEQARLEREQRWPPRSWTFRAPTGYRTVTLHEGPADDGTFRVPVDDDAFVFIDRLDVFGSRHDRYARYSPTARRSDKYRFTGEYFVRWS
jgi:hypothetical protein